MTLHEAEAALTPPIKFGDTRAILAATFMAFVEVAARHIKTCRRCRQLLEDHPLNAELFKAGTMLCSFCQAGTQTKRGQRVGHEGYQDARMGYVVKKCQHCGGRGWKFCSCIASFAADHKDEALAAIERLNGVRRQA